MIHVCSLSKVEETVAKTGAARLLSLLAAGTDVTRPASIAAENHLHLVMHDIAVAQEGMTMPGEEHVRNLLDFARQWDRVRPMVVHCSSPEAAIAKKEYMFPFVTVVDCPENRMLEQIGPTLVCSAITCTPQFRRALVDAVHIDRLNLGPVPTTQLNWLQPHEGNIVEFLFRARAFQSAPV